MVLVECLDGLPLRGNDGRRGDEASALIQIDVDSDGFRRPVLSVA